jgi:hypothetical protein
MRCQCCNEVLTDFESTRRIRHTRVYFDLCNPCFASIETNLPVSERKDLATVGDFDDNPDTEGTDEILYNNYRVHRSIEDINDINH